MCYILFYYEFLLQPIIEEPEQLDKKIASNLERQLGLSKRLPLLELKFVRECTCVCVEFVVL